MQELKAIAALLSAPASFVNHCRFDDIEASDQASIGGIIQLVAFADLILRRLYFAARLKGEGRNNERATDAQVLSRVDGAIGRVQPSITSAGGWTGVHRGGAQAR